MTDLVFRSAVELAQMIRDRHVSAIEVEAYLNQIHNHNSTLNADLYTERRERLHPSQTSR